MTKSASNDVQSSWWQSGTVRVLEVVAIGVAIVTSIGSLSLSLVTYRDQQERARSEVASAVVLLPGTKGVLLQNLGRLPVFDISLHVGRAQGVMLGVLAPCHEIDVSRYGELREIEDRDGD